jgi:hypothetical protein
MLAEALPKELDVDGRRLRDSWRSAPKLEPGTPQGRLLDPNAEVRRLYFFLSEGRLAVWVTRKRLDI